MPIYDGEVLERYVRDDLALIDEVQPDVVVGDFRLSLGVSARLRGRPYVTVTNAYWSPCSKLALPLPVLPFVRALGLPAARLFFRIAAPLALRYHARVLNGPRRRRGIPSLGPDLRRAYTDADFTLYADVPEIMPTAALPPTHQYLGPILWSPPVALPPWWTGLPADRPIVYVTLGSSGNGADLDAALRALGELDCTVIAAHAGAAPRFVPPNARLARYLPGELAASRARLVICNGGSPTTQQALAAGVPVLGIARNMDQFLNMDAVSRFGAGRTLRGDYADPRSIGQSARGLLSDAACAAAARKAAEALARYNAPERFRAFVESIR